MILAKCVLSGNLFTYDVWFILLFLTSMARLDIPLSSGPIFIPLPNNQQNRILSEGEGGFRSEREAESERTWKVQ